MSDLVKMVREWDKQLQSYPIARFKDKQFAAVWINALTTMQSQLNAKLAFSQIGQFEASTIVTPEAKKMKVMHQNIQSASKGGE